MPTYDYTCPKCKHGFAIIRGIYDYCDDQSASCSSCNHLCGKDDRDFSKIKPQFIGTAVQEAEYNPGLGCIVKNNYHKDEIMKKKSLVEVGNDFGSGEKQQKHFDKKKEEELESKWKDPSDFFV